MRKPSLSCHQAATTSKQTSDYLQEQESTLVHAHAWTALRPTSTLCTICRLCYDRSQREIESLSHDTLLDLNIFVPSCYISAFCVVIERNSIAFDSKVIRLIIRRNVFHDKMIAKSLATGISGLE